MADQKLTELDAVTSVSSDDIVYVVDDPSGSPVSKKITIENLFGGWISADAMTYGSADDPTYTMTCTGDKTSKYQAGQKIKLSQSTGGTKYFIITKVEYSSSTTITMYGGTDYNLENETISTPFYSIAKAPYGFPLDPSKWTVETTDNSDDEQSNPVSGTWYNLGTISISIPIGIWDVYYYVYIWSHDASAITLSGWATLSTANNSQSDEDLSCVMAIGSNTSLGMSLTRTKLLNIATKTTYYLNERVTDANIDSLNTLGASVNRTVIRAVCAYL